jgi:hypothetical protein
LSNTLRHGHLALVLQPGVPSVANNVDHDKTLHVLRGNAGEKRICGVTRCRKGWGAVMPTDTLLEMLGRRVQRGQRFLTRRKLSQDTY